MQSCHPGPKESSAVNCQKSQHLGGSCQEMYRRAILILPSMGQYILWKLFRSQQCLAHSGLKALWFRKAAACQLSVQACLAICSDGAHKAAQDLALAEERTAGSTRDYYPHQEKMRNDFTNKIFALYKQREFLCNLFSSWTCLILCHMSVCLCICIRQNNGLFEKMLVDYFILAAGGIKMRGLGYCAVNLFNDY